VAEVIVEHDGAVQMLGDAQPEQPSASWSWVARREERADFPKDHRAASRPVAFEMNTELEGDRSGHP